ncbi:cytochrome c oxidase assembly factor Coa1 family protein [uncultured Aquimarina sp.]|uniref:cytochrome c oxidase assembly factor Coa1 family protein n=1 Tax=uncultured Aquimarina sp. TaxID=575652 RepID=UPI002612E97B|nr:cytochrome c oxidase assembly factor Coa1 family protein [uncultured Aquimarina sp.]
MTEYIYKKSWWRKNRNWILGICMMVSGFVITVLIILGKPIGDFTKTMVDSSVYDNAFDLVEDDERVLALLGEVQPIGFFELLEGEVRYTVNDKAIITVGIKGSKQKGKMDIIANKKDATWKYETIRIRTKKPKKTIEVLDDK